MLYFYILLSIIILTCNRYKNINEILILIGYFTLLFFFSCVFKICYVINTCSAFQLRLAIHTWWLAAAVLGSEDLDPLLERGNGKARELAVGLC